MVPFAGAGPEPLIGEPLAGEKVQTEKAQIEDVKQITGLADGEKNQQIEQAHDQHRAEIKAVAELQVAVMLVEFVRGANRQGKVDHVVATGSEQNRPLRLLGNGERKNQLVMREGAFREGHPVAAALVAQQGARGVIDIQVQIIQMRPPGAQVPEPGVGLVVQA